MRKVKAGVLGMMNTNDPVEPNASAETVALLENQTDQWEIPSWLNWY